MKRGRPSGSVVRQNMIEILYRVGSAHGYNLSKLYLRVFPPVTRRVIYYHLQKGLSLGEFDIDRVEREQGDFSWGSVAEKTYYKLGKHAKPIGDDRVRKVVEG